MITIVILILTLAQVVVEAAGSVLRLLYVRRAAVAEIGFRDKQEILQVYLQKS
jgi:hypothetical protein